MAALRHGVQTVIIPKDNAKDLEEIDPVVRKSLNFITAESVESVFDVALNRKNQIVSGILKDIPDDVKSRSRKAEIRQ